MHGIALVLSCFHRCSAALDFSVTEIDVRTLMSHTLRSDTSKSLTSAQIQCMFDSADMKVAQQII